MAESVMAESSEPVSLDNGSHAALPKYLQFAAAEAQVTVELNCSVEYIGDGVYEWTMFMRRDPSVARKRGKRGEWNRIALASGTAFSRKAAFKAARRAIAGHRNALARDAYARIVGDQRG
jgi:hypothetical protein